MRGYRRLLFTPLFWLLFAGCAISVSNQAPIPTAGAAVTASFTPSPGPTSSRRLAAVRSTATPPPSPTPIPTDSPLPTATTTNTPTKLPTATVIPSCRERQPNAGDLLVLVNHEYGLSPEYKPDDLVPLGDSFPSAVTRGYPTLVRAVIVPPLQEMVAAMHAAELRPFIVSGFRGYYDQAAARQKWVEQFPEWAHNISAMPGHSEHQLGTTLDFSTPDLPAMVGEEFIEFHPAFASSREGKWLAEYAHEYGFTMSYPDNRFAATGFNYEPWHFRYVGVHLATWLQENSLTVSEYLLAEHGPPCLP